MRADSHLLDTQTDEIEPVWFQNNRNKQFLLSVNDDLTVTLDGVKLVFRYAHNFNKGAWVKVNFSSNSIECAPIEPKFYDGFCDPACPFLIQTPEPHNLFGSCLRSGLHLDWHDWYLASCVEAKLISSENEV